MAGLVSSGARNGLRTAILGAGMIGSVHYRAARLAGAEVTGVLASSSERSKEVAEQWQVPIGYASVDEVLADERVDVVHICLPNVQHAPVAEAALAAGKHVVCEKPLGISVDQAQRMTALARESGLVATVPFVYRYHPVVRELRARRLRGDFGDWTLLHGTYLQDWMLSPDMGGWRVDPALAGPSRAFADIGSHWCDLVEWVSGERFATLVAAKSITHPQRRMGGGHAFEATNGSGELAEVSTEDSAALLLRTTRGTLANATISQVAAGRKNRLWFELDGSLGSAVFDQEDPERAWLGGPAESTVIVRDPAHGSPEQRRLSHLPAGHAQGYAQCFESFVADTYNAIHGSEPDGLPGFEDGLRATRVVDAVLRSTDSGMWVDI